MLNHHHRSTNKDNPFPLTLSVESKWDPQFVQNVPIERPIPCIVKQHFSGPKSPSVLLPPSPGTSFARDLNSNGQNPSKNIQFAFSPKDFLQSAMFIGKSLQGRTKLQVYFPFLSSGRNANRRKRGN